MDVPTQVAPENTSKHVLPWVMTIVFVYVSEFPQIIGVD